MTYNYSKHDSLRVALQKTLSGQHPCKLCKVVDGGKKEDRKDASLKVESNLEFLQLDTTLAVYPPVVEAPPPSDSSHFVHRSTAPPLPPPRAA